ncbi:diphthine synthase [Candidatus Woesearchaeota archaeon]|nr:diphthine synthase [Candidatus Woesearchaeota archaeon]
MALYMIGIGLNDAKDITVKGLEAVKKCDKVYLESYTSVLQCSVSELEELYGKKIILAGRDLVEKKAEETILKDAKEGNAAFLVIGDVFGATTHTDLKLRAVEAGIEVKVIHNASVLNAVGITGLELYKFGKITSIPFENKNVKAPYEVLLKNMEAGLHTLFLLDLNPAKGRFLTIKDAVEYLMKLGVTEKTKAVGCARLGSDNPKIFYSDMPKLKDVDFGNPPFCLIIPANLHFMEEEALEKFQQ